MLSVETLSNSASGESINLCRKTDGAMKVTSSGVTYSLSNRQAIAFAHARRVTAALGEAPSCNAGISRVVRTILLT